MTLVLVFLGGMVGAPSRYVVDRLVQRRHDSVFPWGTFAINVAGSFVLGALLGGAIPHDVEILAGTGICGAFTTFSTFGFETVRLVEDGSYLEAGRNAVGSLLLGLLAAALGYALAHALS